MALVTKQYYGFISRVGFSAWKSFKPPVYDDIVDRTEFRPDAETVRGSSISSIPAMKGVFDYEDGEVTADKTPSVLFPCSFGTEFLSKPVRLSK